MCRQRLHGDLLRNFCCPSGYACPVLWDPVQNRWFAVAPMTQPRSELGMAALANGSVIAAGGYIHAPVQVPFVR